MKYYNKIKNVIIAALATIVFYSALLKFVPTESKIYGLIIVFVAIWSIFDNADHDLMRRKPQILINEQFARYKEKIAVNVEGCRAKGKEEEWLKRHIVNFISHDTKKAFTGPQIRELLSLAVSEKSASVGKP